MKRLFDEELRGVADPIAAELEDHLAEETERWRREGCSDVEARRRALEQLGDPRRLAREMAAAAHHPLWGTGTLPWSLRAVCLGWVVFGLVVLSRICTEETLPYPLIWGCVGLGVTGSSLGLLLLRRRESMRRLALGVSVALAVVFAFKTLLALGQDPWIPVHPLFLPVVALGALGSAWVLGRRRIREHFV